jgi:hypothetical protein
MHIELLSQLRQRLLASHRGKGHLRLESRAVVPAGSLRHPLSCSRQSCRVQAEIPLIPGVQFSRATSPLGHASGSENATPAERAYTLAADAERKSRKTGLAAAFQAMLREIAGAG